MIEWEPSTIVIEQDPGTVVTADLSPLDIVDVTVRLLPAVADSP